MADQEQTLFSQRFRGFFPVVIDVETAGFNNKTDALLEIAKLAVLRKTGARGLRSIMEDLLVELMYDSPDQKELKKIIINKDVVIQKSKPILLFANKDNSQKLVANKS